MAFRTVRSERSGHANPEAFFEALYRAYQDSEEASGGAIERFFRIGGYALHLRMAGPALVDPLSAALDHLACAPVSRPPITVCAFDTASTATPPPPAPWGPIDIRERGIVEGFCDARFHTIFQVAAGFLTMLDRERRVAVCWVRRADDLIPERAAPLRRLLNIWMADRQILLVHGAAVGFADGGVLLSGQGGAGKSISALACLRSSLAYAGDDYCLVEPGAEARVHSIYSSAKTHSYDLALLPFLAPMVSNADRLEEEKAHYFLHQHVPDKLTAGFALRAALLPRVTGDRETTLAPVTRGSMLRALAPTTVLLSPRSADRTLPALAALVRDTPLYELQLGTNPADVPKVIVDLLAALREGASGAPDRVPGSSDVVSA